MKSAKSKSDNNLLPSSSALIEDTHPVHYRGRFAPSPTGPLHLGSLFAALVSYLEARCHRGSWLVRIDDIDTPRVVAGATDSILRTLEQFGLYWDEPVLRQSDRMEAYCSALEKLDDAGKLYACACTRKQLHEMAHDGEGPTLYPGVCRDTNRPRTEPCTLRVRAENRVIAFEDRLQGYYKQDFAKEVGDFIVRRRDGIVAYHLATVVDDASCGVTDVVRGMDLLHSTPRQILLQQFLGLPTPNYLHIPLIVDQTGVKLSKQTKAAPVDTARPSHTLYKLLNSLNLTPPFEMIGAPCTVLLEWAIANWEIQRLKHLHTIPNLVA